ncbi:hypothetical protein SAMN05216190_1636 [Pseudomonas borbori]|uniref:Uncharacterized protein n=1 Tax=Pseudomonas borbori TaxID=289003 RepID=A0A1I5XJJ2_9PSED|nr:hypothetical protein SAMN05216190_1636 [Pseudomonas borbori]
MQLPLRTQSSAETYVARREWRDARLPACPLHPAGGCSFARHGTYSRATPRGVCIARWYCPEGHRTFSLLPDFLAARLPGELAAVEAAAVAVKSARSLEAAADTARGFEVTLPSALRWLRRRVRAVQEALDAALRLASPAVLGGDAGLQLASGQASVLLELRRSLSAQCLGRLPAPLGFLTRDTRNDHTRQHEIGPDGEGPARYAAPVEFWTSPCNASTPIPRPQDVFRRPTTCVASGVATAACRTAAPART